jgi:hypothetical protein
MIHLLSDDVYDYIKGKGTAETETQLNILFQILVSESLEKLQNYRSPRSKDQWRQIQVYKDTLQQSAVTSFELEAEVNRMTFSRNKQYLLENYLLESHQLRRDRGKRPWTYYNTTPLGKVLAMRFWYQKREPQEIKMKMGKMVKIVDFEPAEFLSSFFEYLPRLKKYSKTIKDSSSTELGPNHALKYTFPEIDINPGMTPKEFRGEVEVGVEVKFRWSMSKHVQIIKYFSLPKDPDEPKAKRKAVVMYDYILDSLTFIFLGNLEAMQEEMGAKNPVITKILEDPALQSFREDYQMKAKLDLQESLNLLSNDN